ncbi:hypothetical protein [Allokutzneria albata]|uniref:Asp23 family, cell envelope-related function n=1 Tax=Allokutzneria albata TaxID=211114 RepID=A0A1G9VM92_ALLAB|nr:hypothetical protein [Allokutzneria albata]SDM73314.1 hypothetical protein SAMN04489726_3121 [Allokutzneria albata]
MTAPLADTVAEAVLAHPAVHRLDPGPFGALASYLPGRRVEGVRAAGPGEPVEIGVVLKLGGPVPEVVADLRARVREVAGDVPVDVTVTDVVLAGDD